MQQRHLQRYDPTADSAGCHFDVEAANNVVNFFHGFLRLIEGAKPGTPFHLEDWQKAFVGAVFGWKNDEGLRRYREALLYVPRKNGKTPLVAGIILYVMFCDREPGAQIYSAASERDQAALIYRWASRMISEEPALKRLVKIYKSFKSIEYEQYGTVFKALTRESHTKHGFNMHCGVVDELHTQPNGELVDVLRTSTASRRQPLLIHITTADFERESVCNQIHKYASRVRDGEISDPQFLPVIYEASRDDDWSDPEVWARVNPNLGVSVSEDYLRRECQRATDDPSYENTFKRLHLNVKTEQSERIMPMKAWDACPADQDADVLKTMPCYGGLDLAQRDDIAALCLCWPPAEEDGEWVYRWWMWCPADQIETKQRKHGQPYTEWAKHGYIEGTSGGDIDYARIIEAIVAICEEYQVVDIGYDPYNATHMQQQLREKHGIPMVVMRQGALTLNEPTKHFLGRVGERRVNHGGNPVARWMASNLAVKRDHADNIVPTKGASDGKIDGIVAAIMATGRAMFAEDDTQEPGMAIV